MIFFCVEVRGDSSNRPGPHINRCG